MLVRMAPERQRCFREGLMREAHLLLLALILTGLIAGGGARLLQDGALATNFWAASTSLGAAAALWWIVASLREHRLGGDFVALLALGGALAVHEELAGAVIAVMLASGRALEVYATGRADRELRSLLARSSHGSSPKRSDIRDRPDRVRQAR